MIAPNLSKRFCSTGVGTPLWLTLMMGLLCFGIFILVLGSPDTLWSIDDTTEPFTDSVLEGFSIPSKAVALTGSFSSAPLLQDQSWFAPPAIDRSLFHPPNTNR
jgi:hypothetical protein